MLCRPSWFRAIAETEPTNATLLCSAKSSVPHESGAVATTDSRIPNGRSGSSETVPPAMDQVRFTRRAPPRRPLFRQRLTLIHVRDFEGHVEWVKCGDCASWRTVNICEGYSGVSQPRGKSAVLRQHWFVWGEYGCMLAALLPKSHRSHVDSARPSRSRRRVSTRGLTRN